MPAPETRGPVDGPVRCAVLGRPVEHSLSPVLHRAAYAELGLGWRYDAVEVSEQSLAGFVGDLGPSWRGLSLTMPLKRAVLPLLSEVSDTVRATGAANTVLREVDGRLLGDNTDVPGLVAALAERGLSDIGSALVLGGGATATSTVVALERLGCRRITLAARDPRRAAEAAEAGTAVRVVQLSDLVAQRVDLVVSTIPAAAQDSAVLELTGRAVALFDVIYDPWPTSLAVAFADAGRPVLGGLDLLVHQAALQVELMTGRPTAPLAAMRAAGAQALAARH
ncbi:MAG TPA: shikimate dehydrogenase [Nocardioidaceae bacterium]|nr:shikimate dehydrogenase [Nocardioidaceae bacterium]